MTSSIPGSQPLKVMIADDEDLARKRLRALLDRSAASLNLSFDCYFAEDGTAAIELIQKIEPHIVFLDVQMPEVDGINVALNFALRHFSLIFQTAHAEHAVHAFEMSATDYLLKPFTYERFEQALQKAINEQGNYRSIGLKKFEKNDDPLANALASQKIFLEHIAVKLGSRVRFVPIEEIKYFVSTEHITQLFTADCDYACDPSLGMLEARLPPKEFLRIHRNAIVRIKEIENFIQEGNAAIVTLKNGIELKVSRERKKILKEVMGI